MQIAFSCWSSASERRKRSSEVCAPCALDWAGQSQGSAVDRHVLVRRDDINTVGLNNGPVGRLDDRHRRLARNQLRHQAFMSRIEVGDENEGDPALARQGRE